MQHHGTELDRAKDRAARKLQEAEAYRAGQVQQDDQPGVTAKSGKRPAAEATQKERDQARKIYLVSLWMPPLALIGLALELIARLTNLKLPDGLQIFGIRSGYAFVRWHTVQWTLLTLAVLVCGMAGWGSDAQLILIAIGGWYWGNYVGLQQVNRGDCWLWRWWEDAADLPRPWTVAPDATAAPTPPTPAPTSAEPLPSPAPARPGPTVPAEPHAAFAQGQSFALQGQRDEAVACFLAAFREGPPDLRRQAMAELEKLGEVETF